MAGRAVGLLVALVAALALLGLALGAGAAQQQTGASLWALIPAAFVSGMLSFLSPCSLPLLPAYFAYSFQASRRSIVLMTATFFLGLATTMTVLGASVSAVGGLLVRNIPSLSLAGGILIIGFGVLSLLGQGFTGVQFQEKPSLTIGGSFVYGATFAIGWTACIGPILGAVLTLLATQGSGIIEGAFLSFVYALGLGSPLILIASLFSRLGHGSRFWRFIRGRGFEVKLGSRSLALHTTGLISGILLIGMGFLLLSGKLTEITQLAATSPLSMWVVTTDDKLRLWFGLR